MVLQLIIQSYSERRAAKLDKLLTKKERATNNPTDSAEEQPESKQSAQPDDNNQPCKHVDDSAGSPPKLMIDTTMSGPNDGAVTNNCQTGVSLKEPQMVS